MNILGIHGGFTTGQHDAGAVLMIDGRLVCSIEEERLSRVKSATGVLPIESIAACLSEARLTMRDIDFVAIAGETYSDIESRTMEWITHHFGYSPKIRIVNHQTAHLASAFFPSGFTSAMCLSADAFGDGLSGAVATADRQNGLRINRTIPALNSLGVFYATITSFLGFRPGDDEYKVMGLAPYGEPKIDLEAFCRPEGDGFLCEPKYFRARKSATVYEPFYSTALVDLLGPPRRNREPITEFHKNIAASAQETLEKCLVSLVTQMHKDFGMRSLCFAGGVALNCSANRLLNSLPFIDNLYVQPAASDRGLPLGCALHIAFLEGEALSPIESTFYGPTIETADIENALLVTGVKNIALENPEKIAAEKLAKGEIIGWFQGRSEFGPRALGHRSILANPCIADMKDKINAKVKFREEFRPFAPSVLEEKSSEIYDLRCPSPYMTVAFNVKENWIDKTPATTHINKTSRVQTVNRSVDPLYHGLIECFESYTGCPAVLNTSFNIKGQPIVESPLEAISTFFSTGLDHLVLGNYLISK